MSVCGGVGDRPSGVMPLPMASHSHSRLLAVLLVLATAKAAGLRTTRHRTTAGRRIALRQLHALEAVAVAQHDQSAAERSGYGPAQFTVTNAGRDGAPIRLRIVVPPHTLPYGRIEFTYLGEKHAVTCPFGKGPGDGFDLQFETMRRKLDRAGGKDHTHPSAVCHLPHTAHTPEAAPIHVLLCDQTTSRSFWRRTGRNRTGRSSIRSRTGRRTRC